MDYSTFQIAAYVLHFCAWSFIIVQGIRLRLYRVYPLVAVFVLASPLAVIARLSSGIMWGLASTAYRQVFFLSAIVHSALAVATLLWIYALPSPLRLRRDWHLALAPILLIAVEASGEPADIGFRYLNVALFYQVYVGMAAMLRLASDTEFVLGRNLGGALTALLFPAFVQSLNQAAYISGLEFWPYDAFSFVITSSSIVSWLILAWGMRCYDPPGRLERESNPRIARADMLRLIKALWRMVR